MKHTKEPWWLKEHAAIGCFVEAEGNADMPYKLDVCGDDYTGHGEDEVRKANMERIVSCVNNCAGLNPGGIKDVIEALEEARKEIAEFPMSLGYYITILPTIDKALSKVKTQ